jgi:ATP-binding cassette subfamily F protein uup
MPVLSARGLAKAYGARTLFEGLSLTIARGQRVGLLGDNGAGKSTLLRVLAGLEPADAGVVERRRDARVMVLSQEPVLDDTLTARATIELGLAAWSTAKRRHDEVSARLGAGEHDDALLTEQATLGEAIERLGGWAMDHVLEHIAAKVGVRDLDRAVGTMSGGERRRVALAQLLVARPDLAILDEPTNHLDVETITWLEEHLAGDFPGAVLMVTHDRYVLDAICDRVVELEFGTLREFEGGYFDYVEQKAELVAHLERTERNRLNLLRREQAWLARQPKARTTKQKARIQRAQTLAATDAPKIAERVSFVDAGVTSERLGKTIVELEGAGVDLGGRTLIDGLTFRLVAGDRVGIVGRNGAGKTTLLRTILGDLAPTRGRVVVGQNTKIAVVDQARANLREDWSVFDNVAGFEGAERTGGGNVVLGERTMRLAAWLEQFLFDGHAQRRKVASLSGGERARVGLAKMLKDGANLLVLDEPTNDLDVATLSALEELLEGWPGCALVVSHDRAFLDNIATGLLVFEGEGKVTPYAGAWTTYLRLRAEREAQLAEQAAARAVVKNANSGGGSGKASQPPGAPAAEGSGKKPLSYQERKELDGLLDRVGEAEARVEALGAELADPSLYATRAAEAPAIEARHRAAQAELEALFARWEELESRRDAKK